MNEGIDITNEVMCCVFLLWSFIIFMVGYTIGNHAGREDENERIEELEGAIEGAKDILNSQSFWCELADKECVGLKSIVYLVKKSLKG